MDDFLRGFISRKWKIRSFSFTFLDALLAVCITAAALLLRSTVITAYTDLDWTKAVGIVFEFLLAVLCAAIVYRYTGARLRAFLTYSILVIYPTVVANGSLWNINCVFYVILFFMGLYLFSGGYRLLGGLCSLAGTALALCRLLLRLAASGTPENMTDGWPNVYEIIGGTYFVDLFDKVSLLFLAGLLLTLWYCFLKKGVKMNSDLVLDLFLFLAVLIPFFAPFMPAWAGYTADIAALIYCMKRFDRFYLPMLHIICSYAAYAYEINGETKLPMVLYAVILFAILANVGVDLYRDACDSCAAGEDASASAASGDEEESV